LSTNNIFMVRVNNETMSIKAVHYDLSASAKSEPNYTIQTVD